MTRTNHTNKPLTLGDLIEDVYDSCGKRRAKRILRLAFESQQVVFRGRHYVLSKASRNV